MSVLTSVNDFGVVLSPALDKTMLIASSADDLNGAASALTHMLHNSTSRTSGLGFNDINKPNATTL